MVEVPVCPPGYSSRAHCTANCARVVACKPGRCPCAPAPPLRVVNHPSHCIAIRAPTPPYVLASSCTTSWGWGRQLSCTKMKKTHLATARATVVLSSAPARRHLCSCYRRHLLLDLRAPCAPLFSRDFNLTAYISS